ncbi:MAG: gamma-glutamyl-gamma-aminobutyrate hydrolase family protein [Candidatus Omnitrophota bacterium]
MKVHVLQHVAFEDIGSIASWLDARKAVVSYTRFFNGEVLPEIAALDLVIVMGGPMSVNDEVRLPWLKQEKEFIRAVMKAGIPLLGICLGAQLIASASGARVYGHSYKEIGWFSIIAQQGNPPENFIFPPASLVFHWHGETFDLPPGAVRLARSEVCVNQAFQIGRKVMGLQFHLEMTPPHVDKMITNGVMEMVPGPYVQTSAEIRSAMPPRYEHNNRLMDRILAYLTGQ